MKVPSLYQLQDSWDDERAHQRAADLRRHIAPTVASDLKWMPLLFALAPVALIAAAALTRALPA